MQLLPTHDCPSFRQFLMEAHAPYTGPVAEKALKFLVNSEIAYARVRREELTQTTDLNGNEESIVFSDPYFSPEAVDLIFNICKKRKYPPSVRYLTLQYFAFYAAKLLKESGHSTTSPRTLLPLNSRNMLFMVAVCLQLATKVEFDVDGMLVSDVRHFLREYGLDVGRDEIVEVEIEIAITLGFRLHRPTPFSILETFVVWFENRGYLGFMSCGIEPFYNAAVAVLDLVVLFNDDIYDHLFQRTVGCGCPRTGENRVMFLNVKHDRLMLVAGVMSTAAWSLHKGNDDVTQELFDLDKLLSHETQTPVKEMNELREAISILVM